MKKAWHWVSVIHLVWTPGFSIILLLQYMTPIKLNIFKSVVRKKICRWEFPPKMQSSVGIEPRSFLNEIVVHPLNHKLWITTCQCSAINEGSRHKTMNSMSNVLLFINKSSKSKRYKKMNAWCCVVYSVNLFKLWSHFKWKCQQNCRLLKIENNVIDYFYSFFWPIKIIL